MTGGKRSGQGLLLDSHLIELTDHPHMHDVPTLERAVLGLQDSQVHEPPDVLRARA